MGETPANDPRLMWQSQRRDHPVMSVEEVRVMAQKAHAKVRRNLIIAFALGLLVLVLGTLAIAGGIATSVQVTIGAMMVVTVVAGYKAWYRIWPLHTLSPDAAFKGCLDFYRKELEAQYRSIALTWRFLVPAVVFMFMMWNAIFITDPLVPRVLLPSALVLTFFARHREVRKFKHKLARLDEFERENLQ